MRVLINGESKEISAGSTVEMIVQQITETPIPSGVAVAINMQVIPRSEWSTTSIEDDDEIEILWASSGG